MPPNDRIELALFRKIRQITAKGAERRRLDVFLRWLARRAQFGIAFRRRKIRIEFFQYFVTGSLYIDLKTLQNSSGDALALAEQAKQNMLRANVGMVESARFFASEREHFFDPRRIGDVTDHLRFRAGANLFFNLHPDSFEVEPHFLEDVDGDTLPELDQPEQKMLGPDVIVIEAIRFLARQSKNLLCPRSKIIHYSWTRKQSRCRAPAPLYPYQV